MTTKLCETCEGTGEVTEESQLGVVGSGGTYDCPDCDGQGEYAVAEKPPKNTWQEWLAIRAQVEGRG